MSTVNKDVERSYKFSIKTISTYLLGFGMLTFKFAKFAIVLYLTSLIFYYVIGWSIWMYWNYGYFIGGVSASLYGLDMVGLGGIVRFISKKIIYLAVYLLYHFLKVVSIPVLHEFILKIISTLTSLYRTFMQMFSKIKETLNESTKLEEKGEGNKFDIFFKSMIKQGLNSAWSILEYIFVTIPYEEGLSISSSSSQIDMPSKNDRANLWSEINSTLESIKSKIDNTNWKETFSNFDNVELPFQKKNSGDSSEIVEGMLKLKIVSDKIKNTKPNEFGVYENSFGFNYSSKTKENKTSYIPYSGDGYILGPGSITNNAKEPSTTITSDINKVIIDIENYIKTQSFDENAPDKQSSEFNFYFDELDSLGKSVSDFNIINFVVDPLNIEKKGLKVIQDLIEQRSERLKNIKVAESIPKVNVLSRFAKNDPTMNAKYTTGIPTINQINEEDKMVEYLKNLLFYENEPVDPSVKPPILKMIKPIKDFATNVKDDTKINIEKISESYNDLNNQLRTTEKYLSNMLLDRSMSDTDFYSSIKNIDKSQEICGINVGSKLEFLTGRRLDEFNDPQTAYEHIQSVVILNDIASIQKKSQNMVFSDQTVFENYDNSVIFTKDKIIEFIPTDENISTVLDERVAPQSTVENLYESKLPTTTKIDQPNFTTILTQKPKFNYAFKNIPRHKKFVEKDSTQVDILTLLNDYTTKAPISMYIQSGLAKISTNVSSQSSDMQIDDGSATVYSEMKKKINEIKNKINRSDIDDNENKVEKNVLEKKNDKKTLKFYNKIVHLFQNETFAKIENGKLTKTPWLKTINKNVVFKPMLSHLKLQKISSSFNEIPEKDLYESVYCGFYNYLSSDNKIQEDYYDKSNTDEEFVNIVKINEDKNYEPSYAISSSKVMTDPKHLKMKHPKIFKYSDILYVDQLLIDQSETFNNPNINEKLVSMFTIFSHELGMTQPVDLFNCILNPGGFVETFTFDQRSIRENAKKKYDVYDNEIYDKPKGRTIYTTQFDVGFMMLSSNYNSVNKIEEDEKIPIFTNNSTTESNLEYSKKTMIVKIPNSKIRVSFVNKMDSTTNTILNETKYYLVELYLDTNSFYNELVKYGFIKQFRLFRQPHNEMFKRFSEISGIGYNYKTVDENGSEKIVTYFRQNIVAELLKKWEHPLKKIPVQSRTIFMTFLESLDIVFLICSVLFKGYSTGMTLIEKLAKMSNLHVSKNLENSKEAWEKIRIVQYDAAKVSSEFSKFLITFLKSLPSPILVLREMSEHILVDDFSENLLEKNKDKLQNYIKWKNVVLEIINVQMTTNLLKELEVYLSY